MATFVNQTKNVSTFTNQTKQAGSSSPTVDEMTIPIDEARGTIDSPGTPWSNQTKNTSSFSNQTKN